MSLKKISAAAAGLALLASGPAIAANSAPTMLVSAAAVAQDNDNDDDGDESAFERYLPAVVVIVFTAVFVYFLLDSQENDTVNPPAPNPGLPVSP